MLVKITLKITDQVSFFYRVLLEANKGSPATMSWNMRDWPEVSIIVNEELVKMGFNMVGIGKTAFFDDQQKLTGLILPKDDSSIISVILDVYNTDATQIRLMMNPNPYATNTEFVSIEDYVECEGVTPC